MFISVRNKKGDEIGIIKSITDFEKEIQKMLKRELDWVYYCPDIMNIKNISDEFGYSYWEVETDQGDKKFTTRGGSQALTPITEKRILMIDVDGNRYQISDIDNLDRKSFKYIDALV